MNSQNYISSVFRILEKPHQKLLKNNLSVTEARAQLVPIQSQKSNPLVMLKFWGNLSEEVINYYQPKDYLIIEGYISIKKNKKQQRESYLSNSIEITVLKTYPFFLNSSKLRD